MIEGLDGSGKSTQVSLLKHFLHTAQIPFKQIKLPDYDDPSSTLVQMYLAGKFGENPTLARNRERGRSRSMPL